MYISQMRAVRVDWSGRYNDLLMLVWFQFCKEFYPYACCSDENSVDWSWGHSKK